MTAFITFAIPPCAPLERGQEQALQSSDTLIEVVLIDAPEQPIERLKKQQ
ncbi:hypothetical protein [Candidatus Roseilinea sp. NK_OTU-006]|nr:hypothetical protein [Candidatus Roseilinea sp. NK_OTU-006]